MTSLAAIARQPRLIEQALSPLHDRVATLLRHAHAQAGSPRHRAVAVVIGAVMPFAAYSAYLLPDILLMSNACLGSPPV